MYEPIIIWDTFRSEKHSAHPLSQAQGGLFCVLTVFACHWESSDRDWMKCTGCKRLLLVKPFYLTCFFFASLENYFGFRTTNIKGKMDRSVSHRWNKKFWTFSKGQAFFRLCIWIICKLILRAVFHLNSFTGLNYNPLVFSYK